MHAPPPGEVHLYLVRIPSRDEDLGALLARLTPEERERSTRKRVAEKRREYVAGQATLRSVLGAALGIPAADLIRRKEKLFREVGDPECDYSDTAAIRLLAEHPRLMERPIVVRGDRAAIGRPPENVLSLLD